MSANNENQNYQPSPLDVLFAVSIVIAFAIVVAISISKLNEEYPLRKEVLYTFDKSTRCAEPIVKPEPVNIDGKEVYLPLYLYYDPLCSEEDILQARLDSILKKVEGKGPLLIITGGEEK